MTYLGDALQENIFLEPVTCDEINSNASNLNNNSTESDEISAVYLKISLPSIANPLVYICNMSLSEGVSPTQLKWPMMYPYINVVTPSCLTIIDLSLCYAHYQKSLKRLCIIGSYIF